MKLRYLPLALILAVALAGCGSDPYLDMPRNCMASTGKPVVCASPVNIRDLINQPRKHVESLLGKDVKKELGAVRELDQFSLYRGGGIAVLYDAHDIAHHGNSGDSISNTQGAVFFCMTPIPNKMVGKF